MESDISLPSTASGGMALCRKESLFIIAYAHLFTTVIFLMTSKKTISHSFSSFLPSMNFSFALKRMRTHSDTEMTPY